jgi:hypothetical protein
LELNAHTVQNGFSKKIAKHFQNSRNIKDGDLKLPILFPLDYWKKIKEENIL